MDASLTTRGTMLIRSAVARSDERHNLTSGDLRRNTLSVHGHRPVPVRLYLIGGLVYNCIITAAFGGVAWVVLRILSI